MKVNSGFTLVELMAVVAIGAILMAIGAPSYRYVTNSNRISAEVNGLLGDLQFARSEAIKEGGTVTVCPSTDNKTCTNNSHTWNTGWIVVSPPPASTVLRTQPAFATTKDSLVSKDGQTAAITFDRNGFAGAQPVLNNGSVVIKLTTTPDNQNWTRCVEVVVGGSITTEKIGQNNCS